MSGNITKAVVRALDKVVAAVTNDATPAHLVTGARGEEDAYFFLRDLGYVMVARNYRSPKRRGELDIIAWDGDTLCFVEVKTRTTLAVKPAEAAVDADKRRELTYMARDYLRKLKQRPAVRGDIISVYHLGSARPEITHFKNAFPLA